MVIALGESHASIPMKTPPAGPGEDVDVQNNGGVTNQPFGVDTMGRKGVRNGKASGVTNHRMGEHPGGTRPNEDWRGGHAEM